MCLVKLLFFSFTNNSSLCFSPYIQSGNVFDNLIFRSPQAKEKFPMLGWQTKRAWCSQIEPKYHFDNQNKKHGLIQCSLKTKSIKFLQSASVNSYLFN